MKRCPKCNSVFTYNSYSYCLDDGTLLLTDKSTQYDPNAETLIVNSSELSATSKRQIKVIRRQVFEEMGDTIREIAYPQIQNLESAYIQRRINTFLRKKFLREEKEKDVYVSELEEEPDYQEYVGFGVTLNDGEILSLKLWSSIEMGGAHPINGYEAFNIDVRSGYNFTFEDLFKLDSDYKIIVPELITTSLKKQLEKEGMTYITFEKKEGYDFYLTKKNLVIFNLYPFHAIQSLEAPIKLTEIADIVHPEGPLYKLLNN